jgi:hypothetical protein
MNYMSPNVLITGGTDGIGKAKWLGSCRASAQIAFSNFVYPQTLCEIPRGNPSNQLALEIRMEEIYGYNN